MQVMPPKDLWPEFHGTAFWRPDVPRTPIEHLVEYLLTGTLALSTPAGIEDLAEEVLQFDVRNIRAVVIGGGTGLSTIIGGNSQMPDWPDQLRVGLKQDFSHLDSIVCTTDDGGSTGRLLQSLPMIGIGDVRKLLISSLLPGNLRRKYNVDDEGAGIIARMIQSLFNHRFSKDASSFEPVRNPFLTIPENLRLACPPLLKNALCELGACISPGGSGPTIVPAGHSMGNLLLTAAVFKATQGQAHCPPGLREIQKGIDYVALLIGAPVGRIHAATSTPGQLVFRYANGVEVCGQSKSARARRDSPVEQVTAVFTNPPVVSAAVRKAIADADLIVYAPGSLYTSILPVLQLEPVVSAIRSNRKALKILGANSWIQEGETDISLKNQGRGFLVSELIEAYERNVRHGIRGLFDVVLSANLEHIPGNILRNYALEGKSPIHLDKFNVETMGIHAVEATLFSAEHQKMLQVIQHDPRRFALAIRTLLFADQRLKKKKGYNLRSSKGRKISLSGDGKIHRQNKKKPDQSPLLCEYLQSIKDALRRKNFQPAVLRDFFIELVWENRDILPSHLKFFRGVIVIPADDWNRSTEWDNILGYFDPKDRTIKLHQDLMNDPPRLQEDLLIALGESLLGQYVEKRQWIKQNGARRYEIRLHPAREQQCFLTDKQLRTYLQLARMAPDPIDDRIHRITINKDGGFLPPGLLFGLLYSWYLCGRGLTMEYEMTLLRWPPKSLIPLHAKDRIRKEALVKFFRTIIFGHVE
jgi:uncharacterized cofD-like protein